jgi:hypothetical protein
VSAARRFRRSQRRAHQHFSNSAELASALASGELRGQVLHATVLHDRRCTPSRCVCEPEIHVEPLTPASYAGGARAETEWRRKVCS